MSGIRSLGAVASFLMLSAGSAAMAQDSPTIFAGGNGEIEATFTNNCVVYYDSQGRRTKNNPNCTRDQVIKADQGVAGYRREQGMSGYAGGEAPPGGYGGSEQSGSEAPPGGFGGSDQYANVPEIIMDEHGRSHVNIGNHCTIYYDRQGRYNDKSGNCSRSDRKDADSAIASYRREQGMAHQSSVGTYLGVPIYHFKNGNYQATMTGGCVVYFRPNGAMLYALQKCDAGDKARAALAVYAFRKDHPND